MNSDQLAAFGRSLYGDRWQTAVAADLNVADRTMRRWLSGENPIPPTVATEIRQLLLRRLGQMGGVVGYSIDSSTHAILHHQTGAWFRFDDSGSVALLNPELIDADIVPLIRFGAEEALRRYLERDPTMEHTWIDSRTGRDPNAQIEIEYKGYLITYPRLRFDSSGWTINVSSNYPHLLNRLGGQAVVLKSGLSLDDAIAQAKRRIDQNA